MVRETFGQAVDDALAQLEYAGVPREAVAVIRQRLRRDKRIVAAAIDVVEEWGCRDEDWYRPIFEDRMDELRKAIAGVREYRSVT